MGIFYAETGHGACIREYPTKDAATAKNKLLREVGTASGVQLCRKATKDDIAWVRSMGGWIPESARP